MKSKLFTNSFQIFLLLIILTGVLLFLRLPADFYEYIINQISSVLKNIYGTGGDKTKIDNSLHKLAMLISFLGIAMILYVQVWKWLLRITPENSEKLVLPEISLEKKDYCIMTIFIILAVLLRIFPIMQSLWQDEIGVYKTFIEPGIQSTIIPKSSMGSHPLMQILVKIFTELTGVSELTLRFPVFIFSILTIPLLYVVSFKITGKRIFAAASIALLTLHSYHIFYSFQMRGYAIIIFMSILVTYFTFKILLFSGKRNSIALAICNILLVYTHLYSIYFLVSLHFTVIAILLYQKYIIKEKVAYITQRNILAYFNSFNLSIILIFLLYLPQLPVIFMNILDTAKASPPLSKYFQEVVASSHYIISYSDYSIFSYLFILAIFGVYILFIKKNIFYHIIFFTAIFLFLITAALPSGSTFYPRYLICEIPLMIIMISIVIWEFWKLEKLKYKAVAFTSFVIFLTISIAGYSNSYQIIQDYKGAVEFVTEESKNNKSIILSNGLGKTEVLYYNKNIIPLYRVTELDSLMNLKRDLYVITSYESILKTDAFRADEEIQAKIRRSFKLAKTFNGSESPVDVWYFSPANKE
jgi:uncharacterized membrane protein